MARVRRPTRSLWAATWAPISTRSATSPAAENFMAGQGPPGSQPNGGGFRRYSIDTVAPILRRGVLLDIAGADPLGDDFEIAPGHLDAASAGVEIRPGD